jgi:hypothetical protein
MPEYVPGTKIVKPVVELDDGNAFAVIGRVSKALRRAGVPAAVIKKYQTKSKSGDYDGVLATAMEYAEVE